MVLEPQPVTTTGCDRNKTGLIIRRSLYGAGGRPVYSTRSPRLRKDLTETTRCHKLKVLTAYEAR